MAGKTVRLLSKDRLFERSRWLYKASGRDMGPFKPKEMKVLLANGEINLDTKIRQTNDQKWKALREWPAFVEIYTSVQKEKQQEAHERALDKAEAAVRKKRRLPHMLVACLTLTAVLAGSWYGYSLWKKRNSGFSSTFSDSLLKNVDLRVAQQRAYLDTSGKIKWPSESVKKRKLKKKTRRSTATRKPKKTLSRSTRSADDLAPDNEMAVNEISFDGSSNGRELNDADVRKVRSSTVPRLVKCAQLQANKDSRFPGTTVSFKILSSGKLGRLRIGANGKRSASFVSCIKRAIGSVSVQPFEGAGSTLTIPLKVGN